MVSSGGLGNSNSKGALQAIWLNLTWSKSATGAGLGVGAYGQGFDDYNPLSSRTLITLISNFASVKPVFVYSTLSGYSAETQHLVPLGVD